MSGRAGAHPIDDLDLHGLVDGQLPVERRTDVVAWLAREPEAEARVNVWRRQSEMIVSAYDHVALEAVPISLSLDGGSTVRLRDPHRVGARPVAVPARLVNRIDQLNRKYQRRLVGVSVVAFAIGVAMTIAAIQLIGPALH